MSEPVTFAAVLIEAPKAIQAVWAIEQVLDHLKLAKAERENVLTFLLEQSRAEVMF